MDTIHIKVEAAEKEQIRRDAHRHEMTISEYLRWLARRERENLAGKGIHIETE